MLELERMHPVARKAPRTGWKKSEKWVTAPVAGTLDQPELIPSIRTLEVCCLDESGKSSMENFGVGWGEKRNLGQIKKMRFSE